MKTETGEHSENLLLEITLELEHYGRTIYGLESVFGLYVGGLWVASKSCNSFCSACLEAGLSSAIPLMIACVVYGASVDVQGVLFFFLYLLGTCTYCSHLRSLTYGVAYNIYEGRLGTHAALTCDG